MLEQMFESVRRQYIGEPLTEQNLHALKLAIARKITSLAVSGSIPLEYASMSPSELVHLEVIDCADIKVIFRDDLRELLGEMEG